MKNIKLFSFVLTVLSVVFGALGLAAPASAATGDGDFHFTVVSAAYDYDQADLTVTNETRATINGATQLTWWFPNHNIKVSVKSVKKAPHIKVRYVGCAKQSKWIAKKTHGAPIVVAMPGSQMCNTGKNGNIVGGFKWTVTTAAVLKWNKQLGLYQHVFNWKNHKLDRTCGNHIGGHVDVMYNNVVQVQYEQDVQMNGTANAKTGVHTDVNFGVTCPNGAYFNVSAGGFAYGYASANISYTERTRSTVLAGKKPGLTHDSQVNGQATAVSDARLSIDVSGSCGSTPPPSYQAPTASGNAQSCVQSGQQNGVITASGTNPNSVAAPGTLTVGGQSHSFTSVGAGQTVNWDFSGYAPGDYQGSFTLGSPVNKSASFTVHVAECPTPTMLLSLDKPNDLDQSIAHPGGSTDWSFTPTMGHSTAPTNGGPVTYTIRAKYGFAKFVTADSPCATTGLHNNVVTTITQPSGTYDLTLCYIASTEDPSTYGGTDSLTLTAVFAGQTYSDTQSITVNPTPIIPQ